MVSPAEVVLACVEDQAPSEDVVLAVQLDHAVHEVDLSGFSIIELHVAEVTDVADLVIGMAVVVSVRVEVTAGGTASLSNVSGLMDVEAVIASGHAGHGTGDADLTVALTGEGNATSDAVAFELDDGLLHYLFFISGCGRRQRHGRSHKQQSLQHLQIRYLGEETR